jgi:predicted RND superfamily exporter protein
MALSEREQRLLEEMERNLLREDASLAEKVSQIGSSNKNAGKLVAGVLTMLIGVGLLIFAVTIQFALFGVVAFLVMVAGLVVASANFRLPELPKVNSQRPPGFFEDRWNQRFNRE